MAICGVMLFMQQAEIEGAIAQEAGAAGHVSAAAPASGDRAARSVAARSSQKITPHSSVRRAPRPRASRRCRCKRARRAVNRRGVTAMEFRQEGLADPVHRFRAAARPIPPLVRHPRRRPAGPPAPWVCDDEMARDGKKILDGPPLRRAILGAGANRRPRDLVPARLPAAIPASIRRRRTIQGGDQVEVM